MAAIRAAGTKPEIRIRKALHAAGLRYRLNVTSLPGKPDIVLPRFRAVVFVHGCFWHRHECSLFRWPQSRTDFWREKLDGNAVRDQKALQALNEAGWRHAVVWECSLKGNAKLNFDETVHRLVAWIRSGGQSLSIRGK